MKKEKIYLSLILAGAILSAGSLVQTVYADTNINNSVTINETESLKSTEEIINSANCGNASIADYSSIGITVTESQLSGVNHYCNTYYNSSVDDIKAHAANAIKALTEINNGTSDSKYYYDLDLYYYNFSDPDCYSFLGNYMKATHNSKGSDLTYEEIREKFDYFINNYSIAFNNIRSGQGSIDNYYLLSSHVDESQLEAVNRCCSTNYMSILFIKDIQHYVDSAIESLAQINNGTTDSQYYCTFNLPDAQCLNSDSPFMTYLASYLKAARNFKGSDLTLEEISEKYSYFTENSQSAFERINSGSADINDYSLFGFNIEQYQLSAVNKCCSINYIASFDGIRPLVDSAIESLAQINNGTTDSQYYCTFNLPDAQCLNSDSPFMTYLASYLKAARNFKGSDLTLEEISEKYNYFTENSQSAFERINSGSADINDYSLFGFNIEQYQLSAVNKCCSINYIASFDGIRPLVDSAIESLAQINNGTTDSQYYCTFSLPDAQCLNSDSPFMTYLASYLKAARNFKGSDLTLEEISEKYNYFTENSQSAFERINSGSADINDYSLFGFNIEQYQLSAVNKCCSINYIASFDGIKPLVDTAIESLAQINNGTSNYDCYYNLGIYNVNENNLDLSALGNYIKSYRDSKNADLSLDEIIEQVNLFISSAQQ